MTDPKIRLGVLEFLENSSACAIARLQAAHLDQIFLGVICVENEIVIGLSALTKNEYSESEMILAVREGAQGRGIASQIQAKLLEKALSSQLSISFSTYDNATYRHVIKFHKKFGFMLLGQFKDKVLYGHKNNRLTFNRKRKFKFYFLELGRECKSRLSDLQERIKSMIRF